MYSQSCGKGPRKGCLHRCPFTHMEQIFQAVCNGFFQHAGKTANVHLCTLQPVRR